MLTWARAGEDEGQVGAQTQGQQVEGEELGYKMGVFRRDECGPEAGGREGEAQTGRDVARRNSCPEPSGSC